VNYGCKMSGGTSATIKIVQTGTRYFEDTDLSNVPIVILPNQPVGFNVQITGISFNCGPISSASSFNAPNWMVWNQAGQELTGLNPAGNAIEATGCGGYSAGSPATGGSAAPFGGGTIYWDTHTPNSNIRDWAISDGPNCGSNCQGSALTLTQVA